MTGIQMKAGTTRAMPDRSTTGWGVQFQRASHCAAMKMMATPLGVQSSRRTAAKRDEQRRHTGGPASEPAVNMEDRYTKSWGSASRNTEQKHRYTTHWGVNQQGIAKGGQSGNDTAQQQRDSTATAQQDSTATAKGIPINAVQTRRQRFYSGLAGRPSEHCTADSNPRPSGESALRRRRFWEWRPETATAGWDPGSQRES